MINNDTIELLKECNAGVKMGVSSIDEVLPSVNNVALKQKLVVCKDEHEKLGNENLKRIRNEYRRLNNLLLDDEIKEIILLKEDYPLLNADMTILVSKSEGIKVEEEESPQKICSKQGWVNRVDVPVVCLPNSVYVIIMDVNEVDFDISLE